MKKLLIIAAFVVLILPGCKKETWIDWRVENQAWLDNNATQPGVITTPTGLQYKVIREGIATQTQPDDLKSVNVTYSGMLINGNIFDSADKTILSISSVITGFAEGLKKMTPSAHYILYIPYDLAYGSSGNGTEGSMGYIPPYSTLIFDVYLQNVY